MKKLLFEQRTIQIQRGLAVRPENIRKARRIHRHSRQQPRLHQFPHARRAPAGPLLKFIRERIELSAVLLGGSQLQMRQGVLFHLRIFCRLIDLVPQEDRRLKRLTLSCDFRGHDFHPNLRIRILASFRKRR